LHIRWRVLDRSGIIRDEVLKVRVDTRGEAKEEIAKMISQFQLNGYNAEQSYWWGRHDDEEEEYRLNTYTIEA
jgi:hypothetical protein